MLCFVFRENSKSFCFRKVSFSYRLEREITIKKQSNGQEEKGRTLFSVDSASSLIHLKSMYLKECVGGGGSYDLSIMLDSLPHMEYMLVRETDNRLANRPARQIVSDCEKPFEEKN